VKVSARQAEGFTDAPDPNVCAVLVYGPDSGLVNERALRLLQSRGVDLDDPFAAVTLRGDELSKDPGRLYDEATAISLGGGLRVVRAQGVSDSVAESMQFVFERSVENVFIVLEAGNLGPRSRLRRLFEEATLGAALPCYADDDVSRGRVIDGILRDAGREAELPALDYMAARLGGDRGIARRELEKLLLYVIDEEGKITLEQTADCIGDESEHVLDDVATATCTGDMTELSRAYDRCVATGQTDISILRALYRHLQRLHETSIARDRGVDVAKAMSKLRPPVFFKDKAKFSAQVSKWTTVRLEDAMGIVLNAERLCKSTGMPGDLVSERALFQIASATRRR
tara:strand:- start:13275 stop:14300 length:1026 start_codon:yes stop_codon:yes gene_type:complete